MKNVLEEIRKLSSKDKLRLLQCITCANDSRSCGKDDNDEDEDGFCKYFREVNIPKGENGCK